MIFIGDAINRVIMAPVSVSSFSVFLLILLFAVVVLDLVIMSICLRHVIV